MFFRNLLKKRTHYDYIISLGYNCEIAHKFLKYYKFEISNLFNWTFSYSLNDLIFALNNFDKLGTGEWNYPNPLWECKNTHIRFHGKAPIQGYVNKTITAQEIEKDKTELISRIGYLKEKFLKTATSSKIKLYVYKIKSTDIDEKVSEKLVALNNALIKLGATNYKLMIVAEKKYIQYFDTNNKEYLLRFVEKFPPDDDVISKKYRNNGWLQIFDEFDVSKPQNYIKKKKYKYEIEESTFPQQFDLILSVGEACSCTETLRKCRLQFSSYPFDWLYGAGFVARCKILTTDFKNWLIKDNLEKVGDNNLSAEPKHIYRNNITDITFNHDFPKHLTLDDSFEDVKNKYDRRIKRLLQQIKQSEKVLVVYLQTPNNNKELTKEELLEGHKILKEKFGEKIHLLYLFCDSNYKLKNRFIINLNEKIRCIKFDYNAYNTEVPYAVNRKVLITLFNQMKITDKFMTTKNKFRRFVYKLTLFFKGDLWKKI